MGLKEYGIWSENHVSLIQSTLVGFMSEAMSELQPLISTLSNLILKKQEGQGKLTPFN
jgi:hypothetical protein